MPNIFADAEEAQKRASAADRPTIERILDRLGARPIRKPRFILVDNEESVIQDWRDTLATHSAINLYAHFQLFLLLEPGQQSTTEGVRSGDVEDLVSIIRTRLDQNDPFDGFFVDGNLGAGARGLNGLQLIRYLREQIEPIRYAPFALVTVSLENSEFRQEAADSDVIRYMPKFTNSDAALLPRMIVEFEEMHAQARHAAWVALNQGVARDLEVGASAVEAGQAAMKFLERHMGVESLYFRDGGRGVLRAFVMNDRFEAGAELSLREAPPFYQKFTDPSAALSTENWLSIESLGEPEVGPTWASKMSGWRALLARIGDPVDRDGGVYAVYAPPHVRPFGALEGPSLHHLTVQLSNRLAREREREKLRARQRRLTDLLQVFTRPNSSKEVGEPLAKFLYEEFGRRPDAKAKATVRRFERGSGNLIRIGGPEGDLDATHPLEKININDATSTYARVVRNIEPIRYDDLDEHKEEFLFTNLDVKSSLTVPLGFQGTCFGAANLESDQRCAFSDEDQELAGKVAEAAAAAIARHRSLRFLGEAAELLDTIADSPHGADATALLGQAARSLYRFCGFSDLIIALPPPKPGEPWNVAQVFRADFEKDDIIGANDELLQTWRNSVRARWNRTHLHQVLNQADEFAFTNDPSDLDDDQELRPGRPTLSQATLKVGTPGSSAPEAMLALLFEHKHPFSLRQKERLRAFGLFMGRLFLTQGRTRTLMSQISIQSQEAWLGRMNSTYQHQFKTGLWTMNGLIESAKRNQMTAEQALQKVELMIARLAPLADRNKNLIKAVVIEPVCTKTLWQELRDEVTLSSDVAGIVIDPPPDDLPKLQADRDFLRLIFFTLLDNAIRYAGVAARVSVAVSKYGLAVRDDGKGLSAEIRAKLFEPGNTTVSLSTGQGLYVARLMAREMGGDLIYLETEKGAAFEIQLKGAV